MSKLKIIAREITNLTDARYFAAMGVDYLGFDLSQDQENGVKPSFVKQLKDWVSGPRTLAYLSGFEKKEYIDEMIEQIKADALSFGVFTDLELIRSYSDHNIIRQSHAELLDSMQLDQNEDLIIHFKDAEEITAIMSWLEESGKHFKSLFLDGPVSPLILSDKLLDKIDGIVIKGSDEEKTGYKSYDELDELFEWLDSKE